MEPEAKAGAAREKRGFKPVGAARAAVRILQFLAQAQTPHGVTAIARALDLYPGTCFNILKTLHQEHFVAFEPASKTYSLGFRVLELSHGLLRSAGYLDHVRPTLRHITEAFQVTAYLIKLDGHDRVVIVDSVGPGTAIDVQISVGRRLSPYQGAMGRLVAAHRGERAADIAAQLDQIPWQTKPSPERFDADVATVAARGFATDRDSLIQGLSAVAVPILSEAGELSLVLSAVGLTSILTDARIEALAAELKTIAANVSAFAALTRG